MHKSIYIYFLTTATDDYAPRYVGQTYDPAKRLYGHTKSNYKTRLGSWIRARQRDGHELLMYFIAKDAVWNEDEIFWIKAYNELGHALLNSTPGGDGRRRGSLPVSDEVRAKISKGVLAVENFSEIMQVAAKKMWDTMPEETRAKHGAASTRTRLQYWEDVRAGRKPHPGANMSKGKKNKKKDK